MKQWRFLLALVILLAMITLGAVNVSRVDRSSNVDQPPTSMVAASSPDGPLTLEDAYRAAEVVARQRLEVPSLMFASLQTDWPLDQQSPGPPQFPPGGWARFAFVDDRGSDGQLLSVVIERYSGEVVTVDRQPWDATDATALPVGTTAISSRAALLIAEQAYGQTFRLRCPVDRHQSDITLVRSAVTSTGTPMAVGVEATPATSAAPQNPAATPVPTVMPAGPPAASDTGGDAGAYWLVTYRDGRQQGLNSVEMEIDAGTGAILAIRDQSQACDSPS